MKDFQSSTDNRIIPVFPHGGIGTGNIGFSQSGKLCSFEICNKPGVFRENAMCLFAVKASGDDGTLRDARLLQSIKGDEGFLRGFSDSSFDVRFPFAVKEYNSESFPGKITQTVFNPFIPHNETDSGIPCAFFEFEIENNSNEKISYSVAGIVNNFLPKPVNTVGCTESGALYISMTGKGNVCDVTDGNLCFASDAKNFSYVENINFDDIQGFLKSFSENDSFSNAYAAFGTSAAICAYFKLEPGEKKTVRYALSWYFPRYLNFIEPCERVSIETDEEYAQRNSWRNYYAQYFESSTECVGYCFAHWERLKSDTQRFTDTLYGSTLGNFAVRAVTQSLATLKSTRFIRLDNGALFALDSKGKFSSDMQGAVSASFVNELCIDFLFPSLALISLLNSFRYDMTTSGAVSQQLHLPTGKKTNFGLDTQDKQITADVQAGLVIRAYRAFLVSGDFEQLVENWMYISRCLDCSIESKCSLTQDNIREYVLFLVSLKAGEHMAGIVTDKKRELDYAQHFAEGVKALHSLKTPCSNAQMLEGQLHADILGLGDIFDSEYLNATLRAIYENYISKETILQSDACIVCPLMQRRALSKEAQDILEKISPEYEPLPLWYALLFGMSGFEFDMVEKKVGILPDMYYADKTGTFRCFFALEGCFGYVEQGIDYAEINILVGKFTVRSFATPTRPLMVLYGGRKWKFEDKGFCAKLDCDLTLTPDKKLTVIIDVKKTNSQKR